MPDFQRRRVPGTAGRTNKPRLGLRVSKGLEALYALPEGVLTMPEQDILRRIKNIHTGAVVGHLTSADLTNIKKIARRHKVRIPIT